MRTIRKALVSRAHNAKKNENLQPRRGSSSYGPWRDCVSLPE